MSSRVLNFVVGVKDAASAGFRKIGSALSWLSGKVMAAGRAFMSLPSMLAGAALTGAATKAVSAFMDSEKATRALAAALAQQGKASREAVADLESFASALQKVTTHEDDTIKAAMALGLNMGVPADRIKDVTKAAIGLAAKTGGSLEDAFSMFGRTASGVSARLQQYGIEIDETLSPQARLNTLVLEGSRFFSLARREAQGLSGAWAQLKNAIGDVWERMGQALARGLGLEDVFRKIQDRIDRLDFGGMQEKLALVRDMLGDLFGEDPQKRRAAADDLKNMLTAGLQTVAGAAVDVLRSAMPLLGAMLGAAARAAFELTGLPKGHRQAQAEGELVQEGILEDIQKLGVFRGYRSTRKRTAEEMALITDRAAADHRAAIEKSIRDSFGSPAKGGLSPWSTYWQQQAFLRPGATMRAGAGPSIPGAPAGAGLRAPAWTDKAAEDAKAKAAEEKAEAARERALALADTRAELSAARRENALAAATPGEKLSMLRGELRQIEAERAKAAGWKDPNAAAQLSVMAERKRGEIAEVLRGITGKGGLSAADLVPRINSAALGDVFDFARGQDGRTNYAAATAQHTRETAEAVKKIARDVEKGGLQ